MRTTQPVLSEGLIPQAVETLSHCVYLLSCVDGTLYTGYTTNLERRLATHNAGKGARYTRGRRPVTLVACWTFRTKGEALRAERAIKRLSHAEKVRLAQGANAGEEADQGDISG